MSDIFMEYHLLLFIPSFLLIFFHGIVMIRKKKGVDDFKYLLKFKINKKEIADIERETTEALLDLDKVKTQIANYKITNVRTLIIEVIIAIYGEFIMVGLVKEYTSVAWEVLLGILVALFFVILVCYCLDIQNEE